MKKNLILISVLFLATSVFAFEYVPKSANTDPFGNSQMQAEQNQKTEQAAQPEMREIKTLAEYFRYLPREVHRNWSPYKANYDYEVGVKFTVHRDGTVSDLQIIGTNCPNANPSVLKAVKSGAPYQPLPKSYSKDKVKAQIVMEYHAK